MSRPFGSRSAPVRWNSDIGGWEYRCESCAVKGQARFWPLTDEFWYRWSMGRCKACHKQRLAQNARQRRRNDAALAQRILERNRRYRSECRDALRLKERMKYHGERAA